MTRRAIAERKDIPDDHKWDLKPLFGSDKEWEKWVAEAETQLDCYADYQGHLKDSVHVLKEALDFHLSLTRKIELLT